MDAKNSPLKHVIAGIFTLALVSVFHFLFETPWSASFGRASFILLFLILIIGPIMKLKKPANSSSPFIAPWSWRSELGIWFALTSLTHFIIVLADRPFPSLIKIGGGGFSLANLLGLVALFWALLLAATSFRKVIVFIGTEAWKWLHSLAYVIFYLVSAHFIYFQFFSAYWGEVSPNFGYIAVAMTITIIVLQLIAFIMTITKYRQKADSVK